MLPVSEEPIERPATVHAYVECPSCGRIPKPTTTLFVRLGNNPPDHVHCRVTCDRCGSDAAMLHLRRELLPDH